MNTSAKNTDTASTASAFTVEFREDNIAVVHINILGEPQNTLKAEFSEQFEATLTSLTSRPRLLGVIIRSDKPGSFIAGADIRMIDSCQSADDVVRLSHTGQQAFARLENFPVPVVAAIEGACLGGGLELALSCRGRVAADSKGTVLGVPEVMLGLLPGAGGTQRLPRQIGLAAALDLMLTGRQVRPAQAKKLGLVDDVVPSAVLEEAAVRRILQLARSGASPGSRLERLRSQLKRSKSVPAAARQLLTEVVLEGNPLGRRLILKQARKQTLAKTRGHYPAPEAILRVVATGVARGMQAGLDAEAKAFGELAMSPVSRELRNIFHATNTLKKETFVADSSVKARATRKIAVLGAGLMGSGIAIVSIDKANVDVRLKDKDDKGLANGMAAVGRYFQKRVRRRALSAFDADTLARRITTTTDYAGFGDCDVVIEAVFEDLKLKQSMVRDVEAYGSPNTIFASNTSSIPISQIAEGAQRPQNVIGLHYFSPVEKMPLLEIISTEKTAAEVIVTSVALGKAQGKTVIVVRDGPGFYTTRILAPYLNEATRLLGEGARIEDLDTALVDFGFPVGPMTLMDEVGIDVGTKIIPVLERAFGERMAPAGAPGKLIEAGFLGRKSGLGFYRYEGEKKGHKPVNQKLYSLMDVSPGKPLPPAQIAERCVLLMVNEAVFCLSEGVLQQPMHGDIGAIFGLGFPPFLGGPFRYIDALGVATTVARLESLAATLGSRFTPAPRLREMAAHNERFYP